MSFMYEPPPGFKKEEKKVRVRSLEERSSYW